MPTSQERNYVVGSPIIFIHLSYYRVCLEAESNCKMLMDGNLRSSKWLFSLANNGAYLWLFHAIRRFYDTIF